MEVPDLVVGEIGVAVGVDPGGHRREALVGLLQPPGQFTALRTLIEQGDLTQRELTEAMSSDPNTIASLLSRMEKLGWIKRETHERDRRANRLHVTRVGRNKFDAVRPLAVDLQTRVLAVLPAAEREKFLVSLERVAEACRAEVADETADASADE